MTVAARQTYGGIHVFADCRASKQVVYYFPVFIGAFYKLAGRSAAAGAFSEGRLLLRGQKFSLNRAYGQKSGPSQVVCAQIFYQGLSVLLSRSDYILQGAAQGGL